MEKAYRLWRAFQDRILARAAALILLGCTLLAVLEVIRRYLLGVSFEWQQDAVTLFILSAVYLYFGIAQRHGAHLNVNLLFGVLAMFGPGGLRAIEVIKVLVTIFSLVFMLAVVWWGIPELEDALEYGSRSESLAFPMWPFLTALLVGFASMAISMFFQAYRGVQKLRGYDVLYEPEEGALH
jgi:TRAP-type C4-dicarboxylate transport system permease small subunit